MYCILLTVPKAYLEFPVIFSNKNTAPIRIFHSNRLAAIGYSGYGKPQ